MANFIGTSGNDTLLGGSGNDTLRGGAGNDSLFGDADAGNDTIDGGAVLDRANYSDGNTLNFSEALAGVILNMSGVTGDGSSGQGTASDGLGGTDVLRNMIFFVGSDFSDSFLGSSAFVFEQFEGGLGNDTIDGGAITDFIFTRDGNRANYTNATSP